MLKINELKNKMRQLVNRLSPQHYLLTRPLRTFKINTCINAQCAYGHMTVSNV